jgi:hypothetical protein
VIKKTREEVFVGHIAPAPAGTAQAITVKAGHQARVPIVIDCLPTTNLHFLDPIEFSQNIKVASSVAKTKAKVQFVHVMDPGNAALEIPAGTSLGNPRAMANDSVPTARVNYTSTGIRAKLETEALESAINEMT